MSSIRNIILDYKYLSLSLLIIVNTILIFFIMISIKPELYLNGNEFETIEVTNDFKDSGFTLKEGNKTINRNKYKYTIDTDLNINKVGEYKINYKIEFQGKKYDLTRTIKVIDNIKPEINTNYETLTRDYCTNQIVEDLNINAIDNYDGDISEKIIKAEYDNALDITVEDSSNNKAYKQLTINRSEKPKPNLILAGKKTITLYVNDEYKEPGYKVVDGCNTEINETVDIKGSVDTTKVGTYTLSYNVTTNDTLITKTRTIKVIEKEIKKEVVKEEETPNSNDKVIYLTFDDGPGQYTRKLLNILDKYDVKATFFVTNQFSSYQNLLKEEAEKGHVVAVHSLTHNWNIYNSVSSYMEDFNKMNDIIEKQTGKKSNIFRFPGGSSNTVSRGHKKGIMSELTKKMVEDGYQYFDWNVDSGDAAGASSSKIYSNVINGIKSRKNSIVLMHDIKKNTVNKIEDIIIYAKKNGYTFKTLDINSPISHHSVNN